MYLFVVLYKSETLSPRPRVLPSKQKYYFHIFHKEKVDLQCKQADWLLVKYKLVYSKVPSQNLHFCNFQCGSIYMSSEH